MLKVTKIELEGKKGKASVRMHVKQRDQFVVSCFGRYHKNFHYSVFDMARRLFFDLEDRIPTDAEVCELANLLITLM